MDTLWLNLTSGQGPAECNWVVAQIVQKLARLAQHFEEAEQQAQNEAEKSLWRQHHALERGNPTKIFEGVKFKEKKR